MNKNSYNRVILVGELRDSPVGSNDSSGMKLSHFSLFTEETWKNNMGEKRQNTQEHRCVAFGKTAEHINNYFSPGKLIYIEGKLQSRKVEETTGDLQKVIEVAVERFTFLKDDARANDIDENVKNLKSSEGSGIPKELPK